VFCSKTRYATEREAALKCSRVAALNGHDMRHYHCKRCGGWHLTSDENKILPWRRICHWHFVAKCSTGGKYEVRRDRETRRWYAYLPDGQKAGPFHSLGLARQWVDALTFLPEDKWDAEIERVSK